MRVLEEPFMTRDAIVAVLRPGQSATEGPFRTLRNRHLASEGLRIDVRTSSGRVHGRTHLYCSLNTDAARAARLGQAALAERFASRAGELEQSRDAELIANAVRAIASNMTSDPLAEDSPIALQRYARLRAGSSWRALDNDALMREWLVQSASWLREDRPDDLVSATRSLAQAVTQTRADLLSDSATSIVTFLGVVRRMDESAAEIEGDDETRLVPRADLERQGLAILGQAVALLCEALPGGGTLVLPMPAVHLDPSDPGGPPSTLPVWDLDSSDALQGSVLSKADHAWLDRALAREPTAVPFAPLRRA